MTTNEEPIHSGYGARPTAREVIGNSRLAGVTAVVTGGYAGAVDFDDPHFERRPYDKWIAYGQSKNTEQGAATSVWCATSAQLEGMGGVYCEDVDIAEAVAADLPQPRGVRPWVLGTERVVDDALLISAIVINRDATIAGFQDKVQLDPSEEGTYSPGSGRRVFQTGALIFGVACSTLISTKPIIADIDIAEATGLLAARYRY